MPTLQEHLCLTRPNFAINPKQNFADASLFFGQERNKKIISDIETSYMAGYIPRMYLFGAYGTGKTHLMHHLKHHFDNDKSKIDVMSYVVTLESESKSRYQTLHKKMLDAVGMEAVRTAYLDYGATLGTDRAGLQELFPEPNTFNAMQFFVGGAVMQTLAWRWLTGDKLSNGDLDKLGLTSNLVDAGELTDTLVHIGELFKRTNRHLLFMVDESENLQVVSNKDSQRTWHDAFRRLAEGQDNQSVGWMLTFYATAANDIPEFMMEGDITTRLGRGGMTTLDPLETVQVEKFLVDLLDAFVDHDAAKKKIDELNLATTPDLYPFTRDGMDAFLDQARSVPELAIPRVILKGVTSLAMESLRAGLPVFDAALVEEFVPQEFSDPS